MYGCIRLDTGGTIMSGYIIGLALGLLIGYIIYWFSNFNWIGDFRLDDDEDIV